MTEMQRYLLLIDTDEVGAVKIAEQTARNLESNQTNLIGVIQSLGEYINREDVKIRSKAVQYLSEIIGALSPGFLSRQQLQVLCRFLCDRMEDGGAIGGLKKLQRMERFNKEMAVMTFRAIVEHFRDLGSRAQSQRFQVIDLLNASMLHNRPALKEIGDESIEGITDVVSGEKDPRNLMIVFSMLRVLIVEWDISSHVERLFDSIFCYFPITFRPPPNDPYGVTTQDLKARLRDCIAASGEFAPFAFPQLIDKLDSTSANVKKDVLQTITLCASSYNIDQLSNFSVMLWDSLKYEILNVQEEDLAEEALIALQAIATKLGQDLTKSGPTTPLACYLRPILKECNSQLQEPQHKQAKPAGQILSSLARASPMVTDMVVKAVMPPLLTLYEASESVANRRALLEVLVQLLDSVIAIYGYDSISSASTEISNPLKLFKDQIFELGIQALLSISPEETSFRVLVVRNLQRLCLLRNYLQENEIGLIVQYLDDLILSNELSSSDHLKNEAIQALVDVSKIKPNLILDISFPAFLAMLPDSSSVDMKEYVAVLECLARLSVHHALSETLIQRLLSKLDLILQIDGSTIDPKAILSTLHYTLSQRSLTADPNLHMYYKKIVIDLISRVASASMGQMAMTALNEASTLEVLGRLASLIVRALDTETKRSVGLQIYSLFIDEGLSLPVAMEQKSPEVQKLTMLLSTWLMAAVDRGTPLPSMSSGNAHLPFLLERLVELAVVEDVPAIRNSLLRQIGLVTNKFLPFEEIRFAIDILWNQTRKLSDAKALIENSVRVIFWISKGLILRLSETEEVLECLLNLLRNANHGLSSARGFGLVLAPDEVLSKENGATIRLLAKQKVFTFCIPKIAEEFPHVESSMKPNYLIALSGIIKYMPTEIIMTKIETLLPLLLQTLDLKDQEVKAATIESIIIISQKSPEAIDGHAASLINRLLKSSETLNGNTPKVRLHALRCLRAFPGNLKDAAIVPYRYRVTRSLWDVLDDPKREVRKEAVECRMKWLNLDEPVED